MKSLDIHESAESELSAVFKSVIENGENNSAMIIGPRGSGKSFMIRKCLDKLRVSMRERNCEQDFVLVNLSGSFQYDDKSALIEISKQLNLSNVINSKVFGSFSDSFEFLIQSIHSGDNTSKPLIFIMEEFDLFTKNKTQLLLYTILNTIQTSRTPMCLLGVTCRIDVLDLLEKRIKSRFSHRQIYLFNDFSFGVYLKMAEFFMVESKEMQKLDRGVVEGFVGLVVQEAKVVKLMSRQFEYDKSISTLKRLMVLPTARMSCMDIDSLHSNEISPILRELTRSFTLLNLDTKSTMLTGLSILELTIIIVLLELSQLFPEQPFTFDLTLSAYYKFLQKRHWGQQKHEKQIILKAYEHLVALNFILPANESVKSVGKVTSKEHLLMYLALDEEEVEACLQVYVNCPTELKYHSKLI